MTPSPSPSPSSHQDYFERIAAEFDGHYDSHKSWFSRSCDLVFRQGMVARFRYLTERLDWGGQSVLDVGCGPGHYVAALAERGASDLVGVDFADAMIVRARRNLEPKRLNDRCRFIVGDFLDLDFGRSFDAVLAIGYFDYILGRRALDEHFSRMLTLADRRVVVSFPYRWSFKTIPRWAWLKRRGCPVHFYSVADVHALLDRHSVERFRVERMSGTILLIVER